MFRSFGEVSDLSLQTLRSTMGSAASSSLPPVKFLVVAHENRVAKVNQHWFKLFPSVSSNTSSDNLIRWELKHSAAEKKYRKQSLSRLVLIGNVSSFMYTCVVWSSKIWSDFLKLRSFVEIQSNFWVFLTNLTTKCELIECQKLMTPWSNIFNFIFNFRRAEFVLKDSFGNLNICSAMMTPNNHT